MLLIQFETCLLLDLGVLVVKHPTDGIEKCSKPTNSVSLDISYHLNGSKFEALGLCEPPGGFA